MAANTAAASSSSKPLSTTRKRSRRRCVARQLGGRGERRAQQQDAEIGVAAGGGERGLDGAEDACADANAGRGDERRRRDGARLELGDLHAVPGGVDVHVAGLQCVELGAAGGEEKLADLRSRSSRAWLCMRLGRASPMLGDGEQEILGDGFARCRCR